MKNPTETRQKILHAAAEYVVKERIIDLTLDHVAAAAQVSKGGLLHHFPTKLDLLKGLTAYLCQQFVKRFQREALKESPTVRGWWARAYIRATFDTPPQEVELMGALIAAIASYPDVYEIYCDCFAVLNQGDDDELPATQRLMIRMACDGFALAQMSGSPPMTALEHADLMTYLMDLTR